MRYLLNTLLIVVVSMATVVMVARADGALVSVDVENGTSADVVVNLQHVERSEESHVDPSAEPFIPKEEWQYVKPGQSIPSGLHVRLNLETGEREAKLMEGDDGKRFEKNIVDGTESSRLKDLKKKFEQTMTGVSDDPDSPDSLKYWQNGNKEGILNMKQDSFTRAELKKALKTFRATSDNVQVKKKKTPSGELRDGDQLKQVLKDMDLEMKTDLEVMDLLMERHRTVMSPDQKLPLLEELEWLVHQIDNAHHLVDSGGLDMVIRDLNHTEPNVSRQAAYVVGSAVQSNPHVQTAVMKAGVLPLLIQKLSSSTDTGTLNKLMYALSALVRNFPYAQQKLVEGGGLHTLATLLAKSEEARTKVKILTLVTDIVTEREETEEQYRQNPTDVLETKLNQYKMLDLRRQLQEQKWCGHITPLLSLTEHDSREKVLNAMEALFQTCMANFLTSQPQLEKLHREYLSEAKQEAEDNSGAYFSELLAKIERILKLIQKHRHFDHIDL